MVSYQVTHLFSGAPHDNNLPVPGALHFFCSPHPLPFAVLFVILCGGRLSISLHPDPHPLQVTMLAWLTRCLPGFSIIGLAILLLCAFSDICKSALWKSFFPSNPVHPSKPSPQDGFWSGLNLAQAIFIIYAVLIHCHMLGFTLRLGWSIFSATTSAKQAFNRRIWRSPIQSPQMTGEELIEQPLSPISLASDSSISKKFDDANITVNELQEEELIHAIIIPNYCEDLHTLETTLKVLASHPRAQRHYEVSFSILRG